MEARVFLVQVVKGQKVEQTVGPMAEREARRHAQRIADALGKRGQVYLLPVQANEGRHEGHPRVSISARESNIDAARYPAIFSDTNEDGLPDIDDAFGPARHEGPPIQEEETRLSSVFSNVLAIRQGYQKQVEGFMQELASEFPGRKIKGRAKTPYSLVQKLVRSYVLDPTDANATFKRAKAAGDAIMLKDFAGTSIYAQDKHDLDRIVSYIDAHYGGANLIEKEDKYADEDAAPQNKRKGYVAVHYVFLRNGVPVELQIKTERMAHLGEASHTPMKNKTLDIPRYIEMVDLVRRADLGDAAAAAHIDPLLGSREGIQQISDAITLRRNPRASSRWTANDYADLADYTENPHHGHVEAEWRRNPAAAILAAGRAALPALQRLAASPLAQQLAAQAATAAMAAAGRPRKNGSDTALVDAAVRAIEETATDVDTSPATPMRHNGVYDPGILKAVFLAGGPGSGKSYTSSNLFGVPRASVLALTSVGGLKVVNSDPFFEIFLRRMGIDPKDLATMPPEQFAALGEGPNSPRARAKHVRETFLKGWIEGRLGLILDGTGDDFDKIRKQSEALRALGYDTMMVFVNTSLEVAQARNRARDRSLPASLVEEIWQSVQQNLGAFQAYFGPKNMIIIDATAGGPIPRELQAAADAFVRRPVENRIGKRWIEEQLAARRRNPGSTITLPFGYGTGTITLAVTRMIDNMDGHRSDLPEGAFVEGTVVATTGAAVPEYAIGETGIFDAEGASDAHANPGLPRSRAPGSTITIPFGYGTGTITLRVARTINNMDGHRSDLPEGAFVEGTVVATTGAAVPEYAIGETGIFEAEGTSDFHANPAKVERRHATEMTDDEVVAAALSILRAARDGKMALSTFTRRMRDTLGGFSDWGRIAESGRISIVRPQGQVWLRYHPQTGADRWDEAYGRRGRW